MATPAATPRKGTNPPLPTNGAASAVTIPAAAVKHERSRSATNPIKKSADKGLDGSPELHKGGDTIHKAAERGNTEVVQAFLKKNKSLVNSQDEGGHTPLHMAALHNCYDVVDILLQHNPDYSLTDTSGWGLLHFAASGRNTKIFKLLLQKVSKNEVIARNEGGNTPLHYLAKNLAGISKSLMQLLVEKGANVNAPNDKGETPMHGAALKDHFMFIELLAEFGANVELTTKDGETALNWATRHGNTNSISVLLKALTKEPAEKPSGPTLARTDSNNVNSDDPRQVYYELSFFGDNFSVTLNDDSWDQTLYEGGANLLNKTDASSPALSRLNPHIDAVKREELPLSKLFHLYLVISGRNKTDPEIVHWIADFLTGPKKAYLQFLSKTYSYRIRVKGALRSSSQKDLRGSLHLNKDKLKPVTKPGEDEFHIWAMPNDADIKLMESTLESGQRSATFSRNVDNLEETRDRSNSLLEHRKVGHFRWEVDVADVKVVERLGAGSFGVVYRAKWMGVDVALKRIPSENMTPLEFRSFLSEVSMMSNLRHPNVLCLFGAHIEPPNLFYLTEFIPQGSLDRVLKRFPHLDVRVRVTMATEAARGLFYLHEQKPPILHRDMKSLNLLVDMHFHIKLADFGLSLDKSSRLNTKVGTLNWVAPECLEGDVPYDEKADIYSFGTVLWEIMSGKTPFEGKSQLQVIRMLDMRETETIPSSWDPDYSALVRSCWNDNPDKRPTTDVVLKALEGILAKYTEQAV